MQCGCQEGLTEVTQSSGWGLPVTSGMPSVVGGSVRSRWGDRTWSECVWNPAGESVKSIAWIQIGGPGRS